MEHKDQQSQDQGEGDSGLHSLRTHGWMDSQQSHTFLPQQVNLQTTFRQQTGDGRHCPTSFQAKLLMRPYCHYSFDSWESSGGECVRAQNTQSSNGRLDEFRAHILNRRHSKAASRTIRTADIGEVLSCPHGDLSGIAEGHKPQNACSEPLGFKIYAKS